MDSGSHSGTRRVGRGRRLSFTAFTVIQVLALLALLLVPAGVAAAETDPVSGPDGSTALGRTTTTTQAVGAPTISSDKADYAPGEMVTLTGTNWAPGEEVRVVTNDTLGQSWMRDVTVTASAEGVIVDVFALPTYFVSNYDVRATGPISGVATTTFTDLSIGTYDQCANGANGGGGPLCDWINGNLNGNNSTYPESSATVQRLWLTKFAAGSTHSATFDYGTTKAGKHAYDYLTTWNHSESWISVADRCASITGCTTAPESTFPIPEDPNADPFDGGQVFTIRGATITGATPPAIVSGSYAGDSDTRITVTFTVAASGSMCETQGQSTECGVAIWFGAHVAAESDWGAGTGAGSIPGSPYHVSLAAVDGASAGNRDNQMQASAVVTPPALHLRKIVINDNGGTATVADFTLTANGSGSNDLSGTSPVDSDATLTADTWALSETSPAGYTASSWVCVGGTQSGSNITLAAGEEATCTITNNDVPPQLHLRKVVINDNGGTAVATDWTLTATGPTSISGTTPVDSGPTFSAGTYALSESGPAGYSASNWVCVGGTQNGSDITIGVGGSATCTITNNDASAHLTLVKTVTNDDGGTAVPTDWTLSASGPTPISGAGGVSSDVSAGSYALSESAGPAGYTAGDWVCVGGTQNGANISLTLGQSATCTINNDDQPAHLTLVKTVTNDDGGTAVATDWTLSASGPTPISGATGSAAVTNATVDAGSYSLSESGPAGYSASDWVCVGGTQNGSSISLALGQSATCTINNDDQPAQLTLIKTVTNDNGGTAVVTDWTLYATGPTPISGTSGSAAVTNAIVDAGSYALSESAGPAGYSAGTWSCVGGTQNGANISLALGQSATCTINNNDDTAHLQLIKTVTNNNGGTAVATDWTLYADGTGANDISGAGGFDQDVNADTYALSESAGPAGYAAGTWSCVKNGGDPVVGASVTLALGDSAVCTINNNDIAPRLHLRKVVVNDNGGTATVADFTLTANGTGANDLSGTSPVDSGAGLIADTWALSETSPAGYTASDWVCVGGTQNGSSITVGIGGEATCTITNDDNEPGLHLRKVVINDNGGQAEAEDWTLHASGPTPLSGSTPVDSGAGFSAGTYALSETGGLPGYTASDWVCVGGTQNGSDITVGLGESATCTITNDDRPPALHLRKVVVNDNGGTAVATDWTLSASGPTPLSGSTPVDSDATFSAGTYALSESGPAGYTAGDWVCVGGTQNGSDITVALGQSATCTIINNDQPPALHLRKIVVNDDGGTALATDWTLNASGPTPLSGSTPVDSGASFDQGTYSLSESGPAGYTASDWVCVGGTQVGSDITVGLGESATCTITNDDQPAHLTLVKVVVNDNGGTAAATDFTLSAAGPTPISGPGGADSDVDAGSYALSETTVAGYAASGWICVGGEQTGASVALDLGESATCTITNNDIAPRLHLRKVVVNDNGGTATTADFTLTADGTGANDLSGTSPVDSGAGLQADTWDLYEVSAVGYSASGWICVGGTQNGSSISVGIGGEATCTITNNDIAPILHLRKVVINDNGGTATTADFTLTANGTGSNDLSGTSPVDSGAGLIADTWALSETTVYGYTASDWVCVGGTQVGSSISVGIGGEATCTITNDDQPGTIIVIKNAKPASGSFAFTTTGTGYANFNLTGSTAGGGNQNSQTLNAGTYTVQESMQLGWILTGIGGAPEPNPYNCTVSGSGGSTGVGDLNTATATIDLKNGDTVTCVFENTGQGVTRTQGFWSTHPQLAEIAWFGGSAYGHTFPGVAGTAGIGDTLLCGRPIDTLGKLMGGFWSDISRKTTGAKRSALDQARMQLLQQLLAAELNASAFGSVPASGSFAAWEAAYCGTNQNAIKTAQQQAASFNTGGDSGTFTPGTSAQSKYARSIADRPYWNTLP